jgi:hypothetical protein
MRIVPEQSQWLTVFSIPFEKLFPLCFSCSSVLNWLVCRLSQRKVANPQKIKEADGKMSLAGEGFDF